MQKTLHYCIRAMLCMYLFTFCSQNSFSQNCGPNEIYTDPARPPVNPQKPSKVNTFNWTTPSYQLNSIYSSPGNDMIASPFYQTDNAIINHFLISQDQKPADGWEIIRRDLGYADNGQPNNPRVDNPYIILYNKFTSNLRIFVARGGSAPFNRARIELKFIGNGQSTDMQTSLLDLSGVLQPIDKTFERDKVFTSLMDFNNEQFKWHYADFPMMYDPCTCIYTSKLLITLYLTENYNLSLTGTSTGTIKSDDPGAVQEEGSLSLGDYADAGSKAYKQYKSVNDFVKKSMKSVDSMRKKNQRFDTTATKAGLRGLSGLLAKSGFLRAGFKAAPYIAAAISLFDFFTGGGKEATGPMEVIVHPMTINMDTKLSGTMSGDFKYKEVIFWNPGSNNASFSVDEYPFYNEVMGVFNLLKTPTVFHRRTEQVIIPPGGQRPDQYTLYTFAYRLHTDSVKYVLNPASRLQIQEIKAALIIEGDSMWGGPAGSNFNDEGYDAERRMWQYSTDYVDLGCLKDYVFTVPASTQEGHINWHPQGRVFVKFMINFKTPSPNPDNQNVLFVAKYPVTIKEVTNIGGVPIPSCTNPLIPPPVSPADVHAYCQSGAYTNSGRFISMLRKASSKDSNLLQQPLLSNLDVQLAPNPANQYVRLRIRANDETIENIRIINMAGAEIHTITSVPFTNMDYNKMIPVSHLPAGMYTILITSNKRVQVSRFIISR